MHNRINYQPLIKNTPHHNNNQKQTQGGHYKAIPPRTQQRTISLLRKFNARDNKARYMHPKCCTHTLNKQTHTKQEI